jgi:ATP-dependent DNA helicase DinG
VRIFTSATLANAGSFALTLRQLGLASETDTLTVESPFDFNRQALLYLPRAMPEPNAPGRDIAVAKTIADLALAAGGATMALFSSHAALRAAAAQVPALLPMAVLVQGQESKEALLLRFEQLQPAVLLATLGFWQGVDLPAHALRVVVLEKVPFPPPDEPLFAARAALLESQGRSSFGELSLPSASLILRQGFGRLVRSARHVGVVALLDPRVLTKRYGAQLLSALPPARRALRFEEVTAFLSENND